MLKIKLKGGKCIKSPDLTVDIIITCDNGDIVLVKRKNEPFSGLWELPGGFVEYGEDIESTAIREAEEETGLKVDLKGIVWVYSEPDRDPRRHIISICFKAKRIGGKFESDDEILEARAFSRDEIRVMALAFNHKEMLKDASII